MNLLVVKLKEVLYAVMPITAIVLLMQFTLTPLEPSVLWGFFAGLLLILAGLSVFLLGVDIGVSAIGRYVGSAITRTNKIWIVAAAGVILGFFITIAEPDLHILAGQVATATAGLLPQFTIVVAVSVGIAVLLAFGLLRIVYNVPLFLILTVLYGIIFALSFFTTPEFMAISFDASGATTGAMTVPFILALALGVSAMKKDSQSSEQDSFGLVAVASAGAVIAMMVMSILLGPDAASLAQSADNAAGAADFSFEEIGGIAAEVFFALLPLFLIFLVFQKASLKLSGKVFKRIVVGLGYTFLGLVLFLVGINAGFMGVGETIGFELARMDNKVFLMIVGFALGVATILAEPAVYILTRQIEDVTSGYVRRQIVLPALAIGVGLAVLLSMLRILVPGIQLWHYLLPGYAACIVMSCFVPKLFVGMAFDSGGVASGPMTATFIMAFAQGAAQATEGANILVDGFGMIATVALMPIIALQILGAVYRRKAGKEEINVNG